MPQPERFEVLVLGSGAGGKLIAWHLAQSGHRTAVVQTHSLALGAIRAQDRRRGATLDWWRLSQHRLHAQQE